MAKILNVLPKNIDGKDFKTDDGIRFSVLEGEYFPQDSIARTNNKYCSTLRQGLLVALSFHGKPVSVITVDGGVVRLASVKVQDEEINTAVAISEALKNTQTRKPLGLYPA